ncbi:MAG: hypothetical protein AVDCRST_MAG59-2973 [uncultured Thermomicrobiales bacterium]|uniref:Uncharacterized protein n=1 Tax=uncultured Thermomicrobiales bacterium TaxID=1645740 RepID=A0A6J4V117_9BACT|nr:MAG: hypothetical protein AVDCRST_MAG59-2973 [uncultured Thermomicrobiales bacterium]
MPLRRQRGTVRVEAARPRSEGFPSRFEERHGLSSIAGDSRKDSE